MSQVALILQMLEAKDCNHVGKFSELIYKATLTVTFKYNLTEDRLLGV